jgi:hypothetical protein
MIWPIIHKLLLYRKGAEHMLFSQSKITKCSNIKTGYAHTAFNGQDGVFDKNSGTLNHDCFINFS